MSIHVDVLAELNERKARQVADQLERRFGDIDVAIAAHVNEADMKAASAKLHRQFDDIKVEVKADVDHAGFQRASRAIRSTTNEAKNLHGVLEEIGTTAFKTSRGLTTIAAPLVVKGLLDFVQVATQATQSLWLLPAAATAAAAGIGTLALATSGFSDTIKEVRDPEKFAEAIQLLSPAASQAALSIRNLLPEFDALKNATQDAFFKGFGEQIDRLATTYLPTIQNLTTSIATSFNNMITNVADQLMTPETQAAMQTTFANISQMFTNLEPVAASLTNAFTDIATVGSGFLPGLATEIANAATSFENFIAQARASGDLARWIQEGIDAVKNLGAAAIELAEIFYRVFGPGTKVNIDSTNTSMQALADTINSYAPDMTAISEIIGLLSIDTHTWVTSWNEEMVAMQGPLGDLRDFILDIPEALAVVANKVIDVANIFNHAINKMAENAGHFLDPILPGDQSKFNPVSDIPHVPSGGDFKPWQDRFPPPPTDRFSDRGYANAGPGAAGPQTWTNPQTGQKMVLVPGLGWVPEGDPRAAAGAGRPYPGPFDKPPPPPDKGAKVSDKDRLDAIKAGLDPSLYKVADPFASLPGLPDPYAAPPGAKQGIVDPQQVFEAQQRVIAEAHDLEEDRKNRLALERDNESTAEEIADAKWKELEDANALQKAQADLGDKMRGTAKDVKAGSDELSAALDPDLGLGRGLAGLADNLVRFIGHMALAGPMAKWQQTINNQEAATGIKGGYGFFGMRGEKNLSQGLSPLLGQPMPGGTTGGTTTGGGGGQYPTSSSGGGNVAAMLNLAQASSGKTAYDAASDLASGLADCSGSVSDLYEVLTEGKATAARKFTTVNFANDAEAAKLGFLPGFMQGAFNVGVNPYPGQSGHMAATLPNGVNFEGGGETGGGALYGGSASGALDPQFEKHYYLPVDGTGAITDSGGGTAALAGGSIPIPLPVTIVGYGGGGAGAAPIGTPASGQGAGPRPGPSIPPNATREQVISGLAARARAEGLSESEVAGVLAIGQAESNFGQSGFLGFSNKTADTGYTGGAPYANDFNKSMDQFFKNYKQGGRAAGGGPQVLAQAQAALAAGNSGPYLNWLQYGLQGAVPGQGGMNNEFGPNLSKAFNQYRGGTPTGVPGAGEAGPFGRGTLPPLNGPGGGTPLPHPNEPSILPDTALYPTGPPRIPGGGGPGAQRERRGAPPLMPNQYGPPGAGTGGAPTSMIGPFALPSSVARNAPPGGPLPVNPTQNGVPTGPDAFVPSLGGPGMGPTQIGSLAPPDSTNPGGEGFGIMPGGTISSAISGAADFGGFGGGAAAQTLMKLANRTIQYGGEMAGHAVEGLMQTFLPTGGSELAQNSWLTRIIGGISAAAPALPNVAGGALGQQQIQGPLAPGDVASGQGTGPAPGPQPINIVQNNNNGLTSAEQAANAVADHVRTANAGQMAGMGLPR